MKHTLLDYVAACRELLASNGAKFNEKGEVLGIEKIPPAPSDLEMALPFPEFNWE